MMTIRQIGVTDISKPTHQLIQYCRITDLPETLLNPVRKMKIQHRLTLDQRFNDAINHVRTLIGQTDWTGGRPDRVKIVPQALLVVLARLFMFSHQPIAVLAHGDFRNDAGLTVTVDAQLINEDRILVTLSVSTAGQELAQLINVLLKQLLFCGPFADGKVID